MSFDPMTMEVIINNMAVGSLVLWAKIVLLPWRPWFTSERFDTDPQNPEEMNLDDVTVLIPARNEAKVIEATLKQVIAQGKGIRVILINDHSTDNTAALASSLNYESLKIMESQTLPEGWGGKMWGLEQGRTAVETPYTMLLDADIMIADNLVGQLKAKMLANGLDFVSLMAHPPLKSFAEKLLMPAFIYFFKLLYPFRLANGKNKIVAAAAGGCVLTRTKVLEDIGGFGAIKGALIDDCALARKVKNKGHSTWLGLTHDARTVRPYSGMREIWDMVARTAYNQLMYSPFLLVATTLLLIITFIVPPLIVWLPSTMLFGAITLVLMYISYLPTVRFYRAPIWSLILLPVVGVMYMMMTWTSAIRYWQGEQVRWRGRIVYKG